ncbi:hypothetical protein [Actinokineospora sp.]|uniref:hypothetical protein n=1 Tax=Actinokineospora sp. TaxID=1872133 RepID=UPI0040379100
MSFIEALCGAELPVIMEIKPCTGDGIPLLRGRDPRSVASAYEQAGAPCLSVVTGRWFGGTPRLLAEITEHTTKPVLRKDFITRDSHLDETVDLGAAAVLLIAGLLPRPVLTRLVDGALRRGLTPFVEVTDAEEARAVPHPTDCVIAVNNKDIGDRERGAADYGRSRALLDTLRVATPCPVSASGLDDPRAAAAMVTAGYAGVLVGTGLLGSDVDAWVAEFALARN